MAATATRAFTIEVTQTFASGASLSADGTLKSRIAPATLSFTSGSGGAGTIDLVAYKKSTITPGSPSTPVTDDLEAMADLAGVAVDFAHVRGVYATLTSGAAETSCIIGASGTDAFEDALMNGTTPAVVLPLTGIFALDKPAGATGWVVTTNETDLKYDCGTFATTSAVVERIYVGNG